MKMPKVREIDEYDGSLIAAPWCGVSHVKVFDVKTSADSDSVFDRLSDDWRIKYKISQSSRPTDKLTRIDAMLQVIYSKPLRTKLG